MDIEAEVKRLGTLVDATARTLREVRASGTEAAERAEETHRKLDEVRRVVAALAKRSASAAAQDEATTAEWLTVDDPQLAALVLVGVHRWVWDVWRWHDSDLVACWPYHPAAVEVLRVMREAWLAAAAEGAKPVLMVQWIGQQFAAAETRLGKETKRCQGAHGMHYAAMGRQEYGVPALTYGPDDESLLIDLAQWWVTYRGRAGAPAAPGLVMQQRRAS